MDFFINEVMELEVVHITYCYRVIETLACTAVNKPCLTVLAVTCVFKTLENVLLMSAVKYRSHNLPAKRFCGITEVNLKNLTDVHTRRYAQGLQYNNQRATVRQERHIFHWENS